MFNKRYSYTRHLKILSAAVLLTTILTGCQVSSTLTEHSDGSDSNVSSLSAEDLSSPEVSQDTADLPDGAATVSSDQQSANIANTDDDNHYAEESGATILLPENIVAALSDDMVLPLTEAIANAENNNNVVDLSSLNLTVEQQLLLKAAYPTYDFDWKINIVDKKYAADAEEIDLSGKDLSDLTDSLTDAFSLFSNLKKVTMLDCGLDNDGYAAVCDANPDIKFVWEIVMSHWTVQTDQVAFGTFKTCDQTFYLHNDEAKYLKYCTDLVALDLGHNYVTDLSFLQYMPELRVLILVDNVDHWEGEKVRRISDLSYLRYCPKLMYLEFFCDSVSDISFLEDLPNLTDLNISYNPIPTEMAKYLYGMKNLKRLWMEHTRISYDEFTRLQASYPNVEMYYYGEGSIDHDWRTGSHYNAMRNMLKNNVIDPVYAN